MQKLTPELWLHSAFDGDTNGLETRELDFNLARRSAVVINHILGQMSMHADVTSGFEINGVAMQEVDVDPDNVTTEFAGDVAPDAVVIDSSRVFRQIQHLAWDTAAGVTNTPNNILQRDWTALSDNKKPISITNIRHHIQSQATVSFAYQAEIHIAYFIVELSLEEIGILNASRR